MKIIITDINIIMCVMGFPRDENRNGRRTIFYVCCGRRGKTIIGYHVIRENDTHTHTHTYN